ncbi:MAG: hypothetical protein MUO30_15660 [Anaerolineales bacterium]|nr:hypothetical protein [Anaerolineales bacterium]
MNESRTNPLKFAAQQAFAADCLQRGYARRVLPAIALVIGAILARVGGG